MTPLQVKLKTYGRHNEMFLTPIRIAIIQKQNQKMGEQGCEKLETLGHHW